MFLPYKFLNLNVPVDSSKINSEIKALDCNPWIRHGFHNSGHDVIPLLSTDGALCNGDGSPNHSLIPPFLPTEFLEKMPYTKELIYSFGARPHRARIAKIKPGEFIKPHRDLHPNWYNKVRVHIPIETNEDAVVHIWETSDVLRKQDRTDLHLFSGTCWVFDIWRVHAVTNFSAKDRTHLIIDLEPREQLFDLMFKSVEEQKLKQCLAYRYPKHYRTDKETMNWLTGGKIDVGINLWNTIVTETNPQIGKYFYENEFWS